MKDGKKASSKRRRSNAKCHLENKELRPKEKNIDNGAGQEMEGQVCLSTGGEKLVEREMAFTKEKKKLKE